MNIDTMTDFEITKLLLMTKDLIQACLNRGVSEETLPFVSEKVKDALVVLHQAEDAIDESQPS